MGSVALVVQCVNPGSSPDIDILRIFYEMTPGKNGFTVRSSSKTDFSPIAAKNAQKP